MKEPLSHLEKKERPASSLDILSLCLFLFLLFWDQQVHLMNLRTKSYVSRLRKMSSYPMTWLDMKWIRSQDFYKEAGIKKDTIVPYNTEKNGHLGIFDCPLSCVKQKEYQPRSFR